MVKTETCLKVKCLRSDNGREYINGGFSEYCPTQGIRMEKTILGTPQQNGVAECMIKTLNECARSMRLHARLLKTFWVDAVSTASYLINHGPSVSMEFRLLKEVWSSKEVKFCHLKFLVVFIIFILILILIVNLMQSLKYIFSLTMVMRNLAIGFGMNKTGKSSEVEM